MIEIVGGKRLSEQAIRAAESDLGFTLPGDYRGFVAAHDGARPPPNTFTVSSQNDSGIAQFIPLGHVAAERAKVDEISEGCIPIAWTENGDYVCLDATGELGLFFWDHELPNDLTTLAQSFSELLEIVTPFDPATVELKAGQVKRAWIDPDLLASLKKS